jgi:hypothetical protein
MELASSRAGGSHQQARRGVVGNLFGQAGVFDQLLQRYFAEDLLGRRVHLLRITERKANSLGYLRSSHHMEAITLFVECCNMLAI